MRTSLLQCHPPMPTPCLCQLFLLIVTQVLHLLNLLSFSQETMERKILLREEYCKLQFSKLQKAKGNKIWCTAGVRPKKLFLKCCPHTPPPPILVTLKSKQKWEPLSPVSGGLHISSRNYWIMWTHQVLSSKTPLWLFCSFKVLDLFAWIFLLFLAQQIHVNLSTELTNSQC